MGFEVVVTGGNRGIGLGFVKGYLERGDRVHATYRNPDSLGVLQEVSPGVSVSLRLLQEQYGSCLVLHGLDMTDHEGIERFAQSLHKVDLLILNAGVKGYPIRNMEPKDHPPEQLKCALDVNTIGPAYLWKCLHPILSTTPDAGVIYMGSLVGLATDDTSGNMLPYRLSKDASHHLTWSIFLQLIRDWRKHAVSILENSGLKSLTESLVSDPAEADAMLKGFTTTLLLPPSSQVPVSERLQHCLEDWLDHALPSSALKEVWKKKILGVLLHIPFSSSLSAWLEPIIQEEEDEVSSYARGELANWVTTGIEQMKLLSEFKTHLRGALVKEEFLDSLYQRLRGVSFERSSAIQESCFSPEKWLDQVMAPLSIEPERKAALKREFLQSECLHQFLAGFMERLSHTPFAAAICAGWVKTDMGGPDARLSIDESTRSMMAVIDVLRRTKKGHHLMMYDGTKAASYPRPRELQEVYDSLRRRNSDGIAASSV